MINISNEQKTALVLPSGAMMGSYQCVVLKAFREHVLVFDILVGSSARAYNGIRYLSDQMDVCERIYVDDLTNGRFLNKKSLLSKLPGQIPKIMAEHNRLKHELDEFSDILIKKFRQFKIFVPIENHGFLSILEN